MKGIKTFPFVGANGAYQKNVHANYITNKYKKFDRANLPTPAAYYSEQFKNLKIKSKQVIVKCCFHNDKTPSLSINLVDGYFHCFGCGAKGRDVLAFHRLRYGLNFIDAVTELGAWNE